MSRSGPEPAALVDAPAPGRAAAPHPSAARIAAGFAIVYVVWGSTYLAIRIAIDAIPPFTMAGIRFLVAGTILYAWVRARRRGPAPTAAHWRTTLVIGALLFLGGNGAVVWAELSVPS